MTREREFLLNLRDLLLEFNCSIHADNGEQNTVPTIAINTGEEEDIEIVGYDGLTWTTLNKVLCPSHHVNL